MNKAKGRKYLHDWCDISSICSASHVEVYINFESAMLVCFRYRQVNHIYMFIMYTDMQQFSLGSPLNNPQKRTTQCITTTTSQVISTTYLCSKKEKEKTQQSK